MPQQARPGDAGARRPGAVTRVRRLSGRPRSPNNRSRGRRVNRPLRRLWIDRAGRFRSGRADERERQGDGRSKRLHAQDNTGKPHRVAGGVQQEDRLDHRDRGDGHQEPGALERQQVLHREVCRGQHGEGGTERE